MRINPWKISTLVLASALTFVVGSGALKSAKADAQPLMKEALGLVNDADTKLSKATADKGGHRVKARQHLKDAAAEIKLGIAADDAR